ncbi:hypothetical protein GCM10009133_12440 [Cocleimonas flava]|uniref:Na(+)/H(+) antiporter NhaA n=1 Tax=Cocleimonas flava TaxID=634765 RepID=A0A4R1F4Z1_9GAMM|nr:Na+/H+ antiporter NhaA [Cocleimonas flava]TCJ87609.1 sodium/proton antiporter (NhaA family) [Cocleimonas flava]
MKNHLIPAFGADNELFYVKGNPNNNLVAFVDYTCPYSRRLRSVLERSSEKFKHLNLTLAIRLAPTEQRRTESAELAIRAAIAANKQGKFPAMHDALFEEQPEYSQDSLIKLAEHLGLSIDQFLTDMMSPETDEKIKHDQQSAAASAVLPQTPMLFIDGRLYRGVWDDTAILESVERPLGVRLRIASNEFFEWAASAGLVLVIATLAALLIVNLGWEQPYENIRKSLIGIYFGQNFQLELTLEAFINDALMAIFFLIVGIEIKREILDGELSNPASAALPLFAAVGGMLIPAAIYYLINAGQTTAHGWGIPMSTDIAFTLGILALLGSLVPTSLKVFVSALAIADDIGAILVIALFYSNGFHFDSFLFAAGIFAVMIAMNSARIYSCTPYIILGVVLWYFIYESGIHATLAGVLTAIAIPSRPSAQVIGAAAQADALIKHEINKGGTTIGSKTVLILENIVERLRGPGFHLQYALENWNNFFVLPLFAFFNTGILIIGAQFSILQPEVLGAMLGLVLGKPIGILLFVFISLKFGFAKLSPEINWLHLLGAGCLAGVGFTMSIFIASASFSGEQLQAVKLGVLIASLIDANIGIVILLFAAKKSRNSASPALEIPEAILEEIKEKEQTNEQITKNSTENGTEKDTKKSQ